MSHSVPPPPGSTEGAGTNLEVRNVRRWDIRLVEGGVLVELWWGTCLSFHAVDGVDVSFEVTFEHFDRLTLVTKPPT